MIIMPVIMGLRRKMSIFYDSGKENVPWVVGYSAGGGSQSKEANHLYLYAYGTGTTERTYVTDYAIDLTDIATLKVDWENTGHDNVFNLSVIVASTNKTASLGTYNARYVSPGGKFARRIDNVDVSALSGMYYVRVHARENDSGETTYSTTKTYKVWGVDALGKLVPLKYA